MFRVSDSASIVGDFSFLVLLVSFILLVPLVPLVLCSLASYLLFLVPIVSLVPIVPLVPLVPLLPERRSNHKMFGGGGAPGEKPRGGRVDRYTWKYPGARAEKTQDV